MQYIICIQEHILIHDETYIIEHEHDNWKLLTFSVWNNYINAVIGGVSMLLSQLSYDTLENIERYQIEL